MRPSQPPPGYNVLVALDLLLNPAHLALAWLSQTQSSPDDLCQPGLGCGHYGFMGGCQGRGWGGSQTPTSLWPPAPPLLSFQSEAVTTPRPPAAGLRAGTPVSQAGSLRLTEPSPLPVTGPERLVPLSPSHGAYLRASRAWLFHLQSPALGCVLILHPRHVLLPAPHLPHLEGLLGGTASPNSCLPGASNWDRIWK